MKILALHGMGSSGKILESQLSAFIKGADPSYEFVFIDGPILSPRGPGIEDFSTGPFYSYTNEYSPSDIEDAQEYLTDIIDEQGPFDGVLGFSQGASFALSYIHDCQAKSPEWRPFKFAILFSSMFSISSDPTCYLPDLEHLLDMQSTWSGDGDLTARQILIRDYTTHTFHIGKKMGALDHTFDTGFFEQNDVARIPRVLHPLLNERRVQIPTVHITGKRDMLATHDISLVAKKLCEPQLTRTLEHDGGHHIPRKRTEIRAAINAMEWAICESEWLTAEGY